MTAIEPSFLEEAIPLEPDNFTDHMWGGDWIARFKGLPASKGPVGESWDFSGRSERSTLARLPNGDRVPVTDLVAQFPREILGPHVAARFGLQIPFLLKFIDARDDLSVQVHPSDEYAQAHGEDCGKSEAWLILDTGSAKEDGFIYVGFDIEKAASYGERDMFENAFFAALNQANSVGPSEDPAVRQKSERLILPFLNKIRVKPGDTFELLPGTIHAIGRGVQLFEIQQASNATYRVWDWNRPDAKKLAQGKKEFRELHLKEARDVLDFRGVYPDDHHPVPVSSTAAVETNGKFREELILWDLGKNFAANRVWLNEPKIESRLESKSTKDSFEVLTVIRGTVEVGTETKTFKKIKQGHSVLLPQKLKNVIVRTDQAPAEFVRSYVPS